MNNLYNLYIEFLNQFGIPEIFGAVTYTILPFIIIAAVLILTVLFLVLFERKLLAYFVQRKGPNRVGIYGSLQTVADAIKLLFKENIEIKASDKIIFNIAPILSLTPVLIIWGLLPYTDNFEFMRLNYSLLFYVALTFFPLIAVFLAGYASNNKYSYIGAIRSVVQGISFELPILFVILSISILSSSFNLYEIAKAQNHYGIFSWYVFPCLLGFLIILAAIPVELNRCPFDLSEAESELISGYNTEYSGMRFALFFLAEYSLLFASSALLAVLFFGGYNSPFGQYISAIIFGNGILASVLTYVEQIFWFFLKTFLIVSFYIWIRATLPRIPAHKLINLSWKYLLPASIINFIIILIFKLIFGGVEC